MAKVLGSIAIFLTSVLFVLGFVRFASHGFEGDFLPSYSTFVSWFASFPNIADDFMEGVDALNTEFSADLDWSNVGIFFEKVGALGYIVWVVISSPFRIIGWFFTNFMAV